MIYNNKEYIGIWIDDEQDIPLQLKNNYLFNVKSTDEAIDLIRQLYNKGYNNFFLDMDVLSGDSYRQTGGDFVNILYRLIILYENNKLNNIYCLIHLHSLNTGCNYYVSQIISRHNNIMREIEL